MTTKWYFHTTTGTDTGHLTVTTTRSPAHGWNWTATLHPRTPYGTPTRPGALEITGSNSHPTLTADIVRSPIQEIVGPFGGNTIIGDVIIDPAAAAELAAAVAEIIEDPVPDDDDHRVRDLLDIAGRNAAVLVADWYEGEGYELTHHQVWDLTDNLYLVCNTSSYEGSVFTLTRDDPDNLTVRAAAEDNLFWATGGTVVAACFL
jgi:hypothetical protein